MDLKDGLFIDLLNYSKKLAILFIRDPSQKFKFYVKYLYFLGFLYLKAQSIDCIIDHHQWMTPIIKNSTFCIMNIESVNLSTKDGLILFTKIHFIQIIPLLHFRLVILHKLKSFILLPKCIPTPPINNKQVIIRVMFWL